MSKILNKNIIKQAVAKYPTPFYLYDASGMISASTKLSNAFKWDKGFKNYFAVKALPNISILKLLVANGMGLDCSSLTELMLAEKVGVSGNDIMFTSNNTSTEEFILAKKLGAIINLDDISHIEFLEKNAGLPELLCFRYNPGNIAKGNEIIGYPEEAKFGMTKKQILEAVKICQQKGVKEFGLHQMVISNNLNRQVALDIARLIFKLADEIYKKYDVRLKFINLGGGIGIPYKPDEKEFNVQDFANGVEKLLKSTLNYEPTIYMECGRYITGPYGNLISTVQHIKQTYKTYIGLDASMHNLMRPGLYGAYHQITILDKPHSSSKNIYDVTGSLCENNDKFAVNRELPKIDIGDIAVIHDTGAHGHSMGFNYNGKLRSAEIMIDQNDSLSLIRRAENASDYLKTLELK